MTQFIAIPKFSKLACHSKQTRRIKNEYVCGNSNVKRIVSKGIERQSFCDFLEDHLEICRKH